MTKTLNQRSYALRAQADSEGVIRTESLLGKEYLVVPVVALVEGVVQGMNSTVPELALAEEFGRIPEGWDGRPVVMNHPVINGSPVAANSPKALEAFFMGFMFNTRVEDSKLKTEAWIDLARVEEVGGEFQSTIDRIQDGTTVEVSTGLFTGIEEVTGRFNNRDYGGIWRNVVPDHLAFLSEGTIGACSIDDGCGTPRINAANLKIHASAISWQECGCSHGAKEMPTEPKTGAAITVEADGIVATTEPTTNAIKANAAGVVPSFDFSRFALNAYPNTMMSTDVQKLLADALSLVRPNTYTYILGFTQDQFVYETYDYGSEKYFTFRQDFTIGEDKSVTLGSNIEAVVVTMDVTPRSVAKDVPKANSGEEAMSTEVKDAPVSSETVAVTEAATVVVANAATPVKSLAQYIAEAPAEIQSVLNSGIKMHNEKKATIIKGLKSTNRCRIDDTRLNAMALEDLEALAELAAVPTYEGANPSGLTLVDNASEVPPMPALIPAKA